MPNLEFVKNTLNPTAVPASNDLIPAQKLDGSPATYTLQEIADFVAGIVTPTWYTTQGISAHTRHSYYAGGKTQSINSIVAFDDVVHDSGFFTSQGTYTIFDNITKVQMGFGVQLSSTNSSASIIKNGDSNNKIVTTRTSNGYASAVIGDVECTAGDYFQVYIHDGGSGVIYATPATYFWIRTTEKIAP